MERFSAIIIAWIEPIDLERALHADLHRAVAGMLVCGIAGDVERVVQLILERAVAVRLDGRPHDVFLGEGDILFQVQRDIVAAGLNLHDHIALCVIVGAVGQRQVQIGLADDADVDVVDRLVVGRTRSAIGYVLNLREEHRCGVAFRLLTGNVHRGEVRADIPGGIKVIVIPLYSAELMIHIFQTILPLDIIVVFLIRITLDLCFLVDTVRGLRSDIPIIGALRQLRARIVPPRSRDHAEVERMLPLVGIGIVLRICVIRKPVMRGGIGPCDGVLELDACHVGLLVIVYLDEATVVLNRVIRVIRRILHDHSISIACLCRRLVDEVQGQMIAVAVAGPARETIFRIAAAIFIQIVTIGRTNLIGSVVVVCNGKLRFPLASVYALNPAVRFIAVDAFTVIVRQL